MSEYSDDRRLREGFASFQAGPLDRLPGQDLGGVRRIAQRRRTARTAVVAAVAAIVVGIPVGAFALIGGADRPPTPLASGSTGPAEPPIPSPTPSAARGASQSAPDPSRSSGQDEVDRCHTGGLRGQLDLLYPPGQAGGSRTARLGLTNTTARPCTMYGYPGMQLLDAAGRPRPTVVARAQSVRPQLFTLEPGQTAWATMSWFFTPNADEQDSSPLCGPNPTQAQITPPDETTQLVVQAPFGTVCRKGEIDMGPMSPVRPER